MYEFGGFVDFRFLYNQFQFSVHILSAYSVLNSMGNIMGEEEFLSSWCRLPPFLLPNKRENWIILKYRYKQGTL